MDGSVPEENLSCKMLVIYFSSKLECDFYIVSIAKTASNRSVALIRSVKFLLPVFDFYFCLSYHSGLHGILLLCLGWYS